MRRPVLIFLAVTVALSSTVAGAVDGYRGFPAVSTQAKAGQDVQVDSVGSFTTAKVDRVDDRNGRVWSPSSTSRPPSPSAT